MTTVGRQLLTEGLAVSVPCVAENFKPHSCSQEDLRHVLIAKCLEISEPALMAGSSSFNLWRTLLLLQSRYRYSQLSCRETSALLAFA